MPDDADDKTPCTCPACGESSKDKLYWVDDDTLECDCGQRYDYDERMQVLKGGKA